MSTFFRQFILLVIFLIMPVFAHARVVINEIAWMGTKESQYGEWIELYNDASEVVDLAGGGLYEDGGKTVIL